MREIFTSGSVGRAPGNRCLYPEFDSKRGQLAFNDDVGIRTTLSTLVAMK
jgi:hypothetical protein